MKQRLGNFELVEQIDPGGYTVVWRAIEHMGHGVTRPAAVKILQQWRATTDEQTDVLRSEVELLLAVGSCPYIVQVHGFGIDEEVGPWIGMELSGKSLKHAQKDTPADPEDVRHVLHDSLMALAVVHASDPQILHRDIKPNNILRSKYGHWQIADFGLAKRTGVEDTMNFTTVQYAAPELLDSTLGQESPKMDLYSLGMVVYEFALGKALYRKQFPSIYDPYATKADSTTLDERPKWMYWHTSQQMTVPKIKDLIPDFPEDLSDTIASMIAKPLRERVGSAEDALKRVGEVSPRALAGGEGELEEVSTAPSKGGPLAIASIFLWLIAALGVGGWFVWQKFTKVPVISLDQKLYAADSPEITIHGKVKDFPAGHTALVMLRGGQIFPADVDSQGAFACRVVVPRVGDEDAQFRIVDKSSRPVASENLRLQRNAPKAVKVMFRTNPPAPAWDFTVKEEGQGKEPIKLTTDQNGFASMDLAHGKFRVTMAHPRYKPFEATDTTGDEPEKSITLALSALSEQLIADKREKLLSEMDSLVDLAAKGDPVAQKRLEQLRKELAQLEPVSGDADAARRVALQQELDEQMRLAAAGDPKAAARAREITAELRALAGKAIDRPVASDSAAVAQREARRADLLNEMNELMKNPDDPKNRARIKQIQEELSKLEADDVRGGGGNDRRTALLRELAQLADKGDPESLRRMREINAELQQIAQAEDARRTGKPMISVFQQREELIRELGDTIARSNSGDTSAYGRMREIGIELNAIEKTDTAQGVIPKRRKELLAELGQTIELAAIGNADAKLRLVDIHRELATLCAIESAGGDASKLAMAASRMMTGDPGLDLIDRGTLLGLTAEQFKAFLEVNIPNGSIKVELVPHLTKVRLTGPMFNEDEYDRLMARLGPAMPRLQLEVRVDPWAVCRRLEEALVKLGASSVRVHAHLTYGDNAMFIQFKKAGQFTKDQVFVLARPYVIDRDMLRLQSL